MWEAETLFLLELFQQNPEQCFPLITRSRFLKNIRAQLPNDSDV